MPSEYDGSSSGWMRSVAVVVLPPAVGQGYRRTPCPTRYETWRESAVRANGRVRVDRATAARVDLEVQVRRATPRVPGVADVPDQLAERDRTRRPDVAVEVRVEVRVPVV